MEEVKVQITIRETDDLPEYSLETPLIKVGVLRIVLADILQRLEEGSLEGMQEYPIDGTENEDDPLS